MCQKDFTFLFIRRPVLVSFKLELSIHLLIIPDVPLNSPPRFSQHRNSFREVFHKTSCSAKWCDKMSFFCANGQKQQSVTCKFTKKCAVLHYFSRNLATSSEQRYGNINLDGCFWGQMFFEIIPEWLVHKGNWVDVFIFKVLMFTHILPSLSWCYVRGTNFCGFF